MVRGGWGRGFRLDMVFFFGSDLSRHTSTSLFWQQADASVCLHAMPMFCLHCLIALCVQSCMGRFHGCDRRRHVPDPRHPRLVVHRQPDRHRRATGEIPFPGGQRAGQTRMHRYTGSQMYPSEVKRWAAMMKVGGRDSGGRAYAMGSGSRGGPALLHPVVATDVDTSRWTEIRVQAVEQQANHGRGGGLSGSLFHAVCSSALSSAGSTYCEYV